MNIYPFLAIGPFVAVGLGAAIGAWLRWGLGLWLNPALPELPMGTLVANLVGGYLVGLAVAFFMAPAGLAGTPEGGVSSKAPGEWAQAVEDTAPPAAPFI